MLPGFSLFRIQQLADSSTMRSKQIKPATISDQLSSIQVNDLR